MPFHVKETCTPTGGQVLIEFDNDKDFDNRQNELREQIQNAQKAGPALMHYLAENAAVNFEHWNAADIFCLSAMFADFEAWLFNQG